MLTRPFQNREELLKSTWIQKPWFLRFATFVFCVRTIANLPEAIHLFINLNSDYWSSKNSLWITFYFTRAEVDRSKLLTKPFQSWSKLKNLFLLYSTFVLCVKTILNLPKAAHLLINLISDWKCSKYSPAPGKNVLTRNASHTLWCSLRIIKVGQNSKYSSIALWFACSVSK